jgi:hypothetical protein
MGAIRTQNRLKYGYFKGMDRLVAEVNALKREMHRCAIASSSGTSLYPPAHCA